MKTKQREQLGRTPTIRRIVSTTDFSEESRGGVQYALAMAEQLGATVTLVHVIEPPSPISGMEAVPIARPDSEIKARVRAGLDNMVDRESTVNVRLEPQVRTGKPFHEIIAAAREADLIVISTHGYTGVKRVLLGSTAERVVRHAVCPVLTVRASLTRKTAPLTLKKILVPIDFSKLSRDALRWAILLARRFGSEIFLVHVVQKFPIDSTLTDGGSDWLRRLRQQAKADLAAMAVSLRESAEVSASAVVREGTPFDEICKAARSLGADLIVLTTHGHTGLKRIWLGSTAERVVRHAHCPVLAVRAFKRKA
jgi:nucleotide-binding universal stress UspA family protein